MLNSQNSGNEAILPGWLLLVTVFVTGASILIIELIGTRVLAPFFGSGIYTWSALITVTLAALALGYAAGGKIIDKYPQACLLFHLCLVAGLWTALTPLLATSILPALSQYENTRLGVLLSSTLLFSPNLFVLGMASPFAIRLFSRDHESSGTTSGQVFSVSTIGSLIGAVGTGFFLVAYFSVLHIFIFCSAALFILAATGYLFLKRFAFSACSILAIFFFTLTRLSNPSAQTSSLELLDSSPSFYGHTQVIRKNGFKVLLVDGVGQNYQSAHTGTSINYINFLSGITSLHTASTPGTYNSLIIGLGAGQLPVLLSELETNIITVEIDPVIEQLARKHFGFELPKDTVHIEDGRTYLNRISETYNSIFIDAFHADQIAWHMLSRQALETVQSRLKKNGLLGINITSIPDGKDVSSVHATLNTVFKHVRVFAEHPDAELSNIIYLASDEKIDLDSGSADLTFTQRTNINQYLTGEMEAFDNGIILSDEYNPVAHFRERAQLLWRKQMREFLGENYYDMVFL